METRSLTLCNSQQGAFQTKEKTLQKYLSSIKTLIEKFKYFQITCILGEENQRGDALSKLTSPSPGKVNIKEVATPNISEALVGYVDEAEDKWMTPSKRYLSERSFLFDKGEAQRIKLKAP